MGYREAQGSWQHPDRQAIFVGDLIDRGPEQKKTVNLVRRMVERGSARCILGNHEFNAIAWATEDPERAGQFLRDHDKPGNRKQHEAFLAEAAGKPEHGEFIAWFKTLPLWLELSGIRVVHACWNRHYQDLLRPHLGPSMGLTDALVVQANRKGTTLFEAAEAVLKGLEMPLPGDHSFQDKEGKVRREVRIRWWQGKPASYRTAAIVPDRERDAVPDLPMPAHPHVAEYMGPPVFIGHYWNTGIPARMSRSVACVDYSACRGGQLVAYRWRGESEIIDAHFVGVS
jgi:hypothetical protein